MRIVQPKVILLSETKMVERPDGNFNINTMLEELSAPEWTTDCATHGEGLIEAAGRMCYRSWAPVFGIFA